MRSRILLVVCLFGALVTLSGRIVGDEPAQEPNMAAQAKTSQRDQLWEQAMEVANAGEFYETVNLAKGFKAALECLVILEKLLGKEHPDYSICLTNLAGLYLSAGNFLEAESVYREAMAIQKKVLGNEHPEYAASVGGLAELYFSMGDYEQAVPLYRQAVEITLGILEQTTNLQSERMTRGFD